MVEQKNIEIAKNSRLSDEIDSVRIAAISLDVRPARTRGIKNINQTHHRFKFEDEPRAGFPCFPRAIKVDEPWLRHIPDPFETIGYVQDHVLDVSLPKRLGIRTNSQRNEPRDKNRKASALACG